MAQKPPTPEQQRAERLGERVRYDAQHRPVDSFGDEFTEDGPGIEAEEPAIGGDRAPRTPQRGALDPYRTDAPGENQPEDSLEKPKSPIVHEVTEDGRLYEPAARRNWQAPRRS